MANFPDCALVKDREGRCIIVAVTSAHYEGDCGCYWTLHCPKRGLVRSGQSKGWDGTGMGSALSAMKSGKAAARRWLKREAAWEVRRANARQSEP